MPQATVSDLYAQNVNLAYYEGQTFELVLSDVDIGSKQRFRDDIDEIDYKFLSPRQLTVSVVDNDVEIADLAVVANQGDSARFRSFAVVKTSATPQHILVSYSVDQVTIPSGQALIFKFDVPFVESYFGPQTEGSGGDEDE